MARLDALTCVLALIPLVSSQFSTPTEKQLLRVGEVQKIQYRTNSPNYTIAIWQALADGAAKLGPVVVQTTNGPKQDEEFEWLVQLYDFDLDVSNVFFFWLKWGGLENVATTQVGTISSAYFSITDEPLPSSSSTLSSTIASSSSSATASSASSTASLTAEGNTSSESSEGGGLPIAAQAGIGVGASVAGLAVIVCGILWFRHLRKKQKMQQANSQPSDAPEVLQTPPAVIQYYRAELGHDTGPAELAHDTSPVELAHDTRPVELG